MKIKVFIIHNNRMRLIGNKISLQLIDQNLLSNNLYNLIKDMVLKHKWRINIIRFGNKLFSIIINTNYFNFEGKITIIKYGDYIL